jgi:hypothetical protein
LPPVVNVLLQTAAGLFVDYTISRFEEVKQLHIILLVCTLVAVLLFVTKVFRPYVARLHAESKAMAGMMSQLPAEVDIESHVKLHVLGIRRDDGRAASLRMGSMGEPGGSSMAMMGPGMDAGRRSMPGMLLPPPGGAGSMMGGKGGGMLALPGPGGHFGGGAGRGAAPGGGGGGQWEDEE